MDRIEVAVIGGGVVGLAAACAISARGFSICLFEKRHRLGLEASTHNSGVIHAGIYYPTSSLKAELCVEGRERLYRFCREHNVPHARSGKLIVAESSSDVGRLEALVKQGRENGVNDLETVDTPHIRRLEPHVAGQAAIWSPSSGIVEAEALVRTLVRQATAHGVYMLPNTAIVSGTTSPDGVELTTSRERVQAAVVVNAAGLHADEVSAAIGGERFQIVPVRGEYAELVPAARHLVTRPVYPLPDPVSLNLGVHLTRTTWGSVTLGPTAGVVEDKTNYEGSRCTVEDFLEPARRLVPELTESDLILGGSGIRATLTVDETFADFLIRPDAHLPNLIQAAGIDSPGLTSCLAIADRIATLVETALR